jgi:subtilisin family serine protease
MTSFPRTFNHPSFGTCELVPKLIAIRWSSPRRPDEVKSVLARHGLELAVRAPGKEPAARDADRDVMLGGVNQSEMLTWASGDKSEEAREKLEADPAVEWVVPVFRAKKAASGSESYFAVNPTVLLVEKQAADKLGDFSTIDDSATVDQGRSSVTKGFVALNLPNKNAIEVSGQVAAAVAGGQRAVKLENIPYMSPTSACSCAGSNGNGTSRRTANCSPATDPRFPGDVLFPQQWGLQRVNAPRAWAHSQGDPDVVIAVLDQGVELTHPDLNVWPVSYSTITHTNDGSPVGNHGTPCAGIISGSFDNGLGVAGLAGRSRVMAIATLFSDAQVAEGLYFAADHGARVVSMSFGVYPSWMVWDFSIIEAALQYCHEKGVVLVAATGNENQNVSRFPATDPRTIGVGGSNRDDIRKAVGDTSIENWWGACFGPDVDVVAPCLEIPSTDRLGGAGYTGTDYTLRFNGTSSATPHVAGLAGLILSVNPTLSAADVRQIISTTTDKINPGGYVYQAMAGKPYGTWNQEVGYGRINAERALLAACDRRDGCQTTTGPCAVGLPLPDDCCVSPCDPAWRPEQQCLIGYENRFVRVPLTGQDRPLGDRYVEFRISYEDKMCLLGKQHGPLLYTVTLLPGEKVTLYHSERYRRVTSAEQRFSVQTSFMQFLSVVHEARITNTIDRLVERLSSSKSGSSGASGGGVFLGLFGFGGGSSSSSQTTVTDHTRLRTTSVMEDFRQSVEQASQMTHAERSVVVSSYEDKESRDVSFRALQNENQCRAVTYFVRKVVELYAVSTRVSDISYRVIAPGFASDWHSTGEVGWLPRELQQTVREGSRLLPRVGEVISEPRPISLPTDGVVYAAELAHCCSCEPERAAAIAINLEVQQAEARKACLEAETMQLEVERRRLLLQRGELRPFQLTATASYPALTSADS